MNFIRDSTPCAAVLAFVAAASSALIRPDMGFICSCRAVFAVSVMAARVASGKFSSLLIDEFTPSRIPSIPRMIRSMASAVIWLCCSASFLIDATATDAARSSCCICRWLSAVEATACLFDTVCCCDKLFTVAILLIFHPSLLQLRPTV